MSAIKGYVCDCCLKQFEFSANWEENGNGGKFTVRGADGTNGPERVWENLCRGCRIALCSSVENAISMRRNEPKRS